MSPGLRSQHGSVSIVVAGVATIALVASLGLADVGKALVARARARAAADAAALAAAQELALSGSRTPAELASDYAVRNGAELVSVLVLSGIARSDRGGRRADRPDDSRGRRAHRASAREGGRRPPRGLNLAGLRSTR